MSSELKRVLASDHTFLAHDIKLLMRRLAANGWPLPKRFGDTMIMSYVINPGLPSHALANVVRDRLKQDVLTRKDLQKTASSLRHRSTRSASYPLSPYQDYLGEKSEVALALADALEAGPRGATSR